MRMRTVVSWYVQHSVDDALAQELDGLDIRMLRPANMSSFTDYIVYTNTH